MAGGVSLGSVLSFLMIAAAFPRWHLCLDVLFFWLLSFDLAPHCQLRRCLSITKLPVCLLAKQFVCVCYLSLSKLLQLKLVQARFDTLSSTRNLFSN